jgi:hypothetical protein
VDPEEDAEPCVDNDKDGDGEGCDEESEEGDDENDDEEDFESLPNTAAATNNNNDTDNRGSRTKRPPGILTSNARPGSIQFSVSEMPYEHVFRAHRGML